MGALSSEVPINPTRISDKNGVQIAKLPGNTKDEMLIIGIQRECDNWALVIQWL